MRRVLLFVALLSICPVAVAQDNDASIGLDFDAEDVALAFWHGRVEWRIEALDLLQFPETDAFDGIAPEERDTPTQELLDPPADFEGERRFFLSVTINW